MLPILAFALMSAQTITQFQHDGEVSFDNVTVNELKSGDEWDALPIVWQGASLVVRARTDERKSEDEIAEVSVVPHLAFSITRNGDEKRYTVAIEEWDVEHCGTQLDRSIRIAPFPESDGFTATYDDASCGMHGSSQNEHEIIVDTRGTTPRSTELVFSEIELWGFANGGVLRRDPSTSCVWTNSDFDCTERVTINAQATEYVDERRFTAFGRQSLRIASDYTPHVDSLAKLHGDRAVLVDGIGMVRPVMRLTREVALYASLQNDDSLIPTFYLAGPRGVVTVVPRDLVPREEFHTDDDDDQPKIPYTRVIDEAVFRASILGRRGAARLIKVVMEVCDERALFWVAVDPADPQHFAALRVAGTLSEGQIQDRIVPPSILSARFDRDLTAHVVVLNRRIENVFNGFVCPDSDDENNSDRLAGVVSWSPSQFDVSLTPRDDHEPKPLLVTIAPDGTLGTKTFECDLQ